MGVVCTCLRGLVAPLKDVGITAAVKIDAAYIGAPRA